MSWFNLWRNLLIFFFLYADKVLVLLNVIKWWTIVTDWIYIARTNIIIWGLIWLFHFLAWFGYKKATDTCACEGDKWQASSSFYKQNSIWAIDRLQVNEGSKIISSYLTKDSKSHTVSYPIGHHDPSIRSCNNVIEMVLRYFLLWLAIYSAPDPPSPNF